MIVHQPSTTDTPLRSTGESPHDEGAPAPLARPGAGQETTEVPDVKNRTRDRGGR